MMIDECRIRIRCPAFINHHSSINVPT